MNVGLTTALSPVFAIKFASVKTMAAATNNTANTAPRDSFISPLLVPEAMLASPGADVTQLLLL